MRRPRRPTLTDVAAEAGVSLKTVSRVINGVETVDADMTERVRRAAAKLDYRPNRMAALLRTGRSGMIGLIIRDLSNSFYSSIASGAGRTADEHDSLLVIASHEAQPQRQTALLESLLDRRADGLLLTPAAGEDRVLLQEATRHTPLVAMDVRPEGAEIDCVLLDNRRAAGMAVEQAITRGRHRIALLLDAYELRTMRQRADGALEAMRRAGVPVHDELVRAGSHTVLEASAVTSELLALPEPPDAIFCGNNVAALGAASVIRQQGADVLLIAFDDFILSDTLPGEVIVIAHDPYEMGALAARMLFERIADPALPPRTVFHPTHIENRGLHVQHP